MRRFWDAEGAPMRIVYDWVRALAEAKLEYGLSSSGAEPQAEQRPEPPQDAAPSGPCGACLGTY